ncbi:thiolase family protein [Staphylococcus edaphicus]|uniref:Putative acetyl-CoA C-acetyltransferase VraB n=1 Tax=Staphylococcus edaphicus TaxID=1955013 RepID=A0A2C6U9T6_9STAP|nr:thiolase family protein [Staphylococcus edaphicus]PHK50512.1 acetyl-CoA C-acyltransferase [Staphylococcus edaphicus]UQW81198.1 thiolase family protein [Staphylococcus edaphicus]
MAEAVIVAAKRTAFGKYGGSLRHVEPEDLLKPLFQHFTEKYAKAMLHIDDVVLGNVVGNGGNIARKALLEANLNIHIPGLTLDRQCGSGLEAITYACRMVQAGAGNMYIAGGVESTSRAPWKIKRPQSVYDTHLPEFYERASFAPENQDPSMIEAAENVAQTYGITREDQDLYALNSHNKTIDAYKQNLIQQEIISLKIKGEIFNRDESIKTRLSEQTLNRLKPLLPGGSVTAGNCCMKNDGAVLLLIMDKTTAISHGFNEGLVFKDSVTLGVEPTLLGIGPVPAVSRLLSKHAYTIDDINAIELNEAFASQVVASQRHLSIADEKLNKYGGAIATGHPYGASGAALVNRLFHMKSETRTIATMGIGGGMGNAVLFERWS